MFLDGLYAPVPGVAAELQDVPQREPDVFQQLPRRIRKSLRHAPAQLGREVANRSMEVGMRFVPVDCLRKLLTEGFIVAHGEPRRIRVSDVSAKLRDVNSRTVYWERSRATAPPALLQDSGRSGVHQNRKSIAQVVAIHLHQGGTFAFNTAAEYATEAQQ